MDYVEKARRAQQDYEQKHDVQLEIKGRKTMTAFMVLNDGETYTTVVGCKIVDIDTAGLEDYEIEEYLKILNDPQRETAGEGIAKIVTRFS